jgi:hypothetical protein
MGDKTKVTITKVPLFPDDPVRQEAIQRLVKDALGARRTRAKGLKAANEPKQEKAREGKAIALKIADDLMRKGIRVTAKHVRNNWPKPNPPSERTLCRWLSKK